MPEQFISKEIAIQAPVSKVWEVLVKKQYLEQWIPEFSKGVVVTEDWHLNGTVAMTDNDGTVLLEGAITAFEPNRRLKVEFKNSSYAEEITLAAKGNLTFLSVHGGPVAHTEQQEHTAIWEKGLGKIKDLSEAP